MAVTSLSLAFLGFVALALAMARHHEQMLGGRPDLRFRSGMRLGGALLLAVSAVPCVVAYGWSVGLTWWLGVLTAAAMPLVLLLTYRPKAIPGVALAMPLLALAALAFQV